MNSQQIAEIIKERLYRAQYDYQNFSGYPLAELVARQSELNSIAYLMAEALSYSEKDFNREKFMKDCGF